MTKEAIPLNTALYTQRKLRGWSQAKLAELIGASEEMISKWERGKKRTSPYYQEKLCDLFGKNAEELGFLFPIPFPDQKELQEQKQQDRALNSLIDQKDEDIDFNAIQTFLVDNSNNSRDERGDTFIPLPATDRQSSFPRIWNVPYQRNPFFIGRDDVLTRLHEMLNREKAISAPQALCGLGGIGKTQTVLEYIYRYKSEYQSVIWIKADTHENLFADFLSLAQLLALPEQDTQDQVVVTIAIQRWLREHTEWLLVFDNADDLEMVQEILPTGYQGHVLLTTRARAMGRIAHRLEIEEMDQEIGVLFLLRRAGLIEPDAPLEKTSEKERALAEELVQELGGLPLALDQAGAYIEETATSLQGYLDFYHTYRLALLQRRGGLTADHPELVANNLGTRIYVYRGQ